MKSVFKRALVLNIGVLLCTFVFGQHGMVKVDSNVELPDFQCDRVINFLNPGDEPLAIDSSGNTYFYNPSNEPTYWKVSGSDTSEIIVPPFDLNDALNHLDDIEFNDPTLEFVHYNNEIIRILVTPNNDDVYILRVVRMVLYGEQDPEPVFLYVPHLYELKNSEVSLYSYNEFSSDFLEAIWVNYDDAYATENFIWFKQLRNGVGVLRFNKQTSQMDLFHSGNSIITPFPYGDYPDLRGNNKDEMIFTARGEVILFDDDNPVGEYLFKGDSVQTSFYKQENYLFVGTDSLYIRENGNESTLKYDPDPRFGKPYHVQKAANSPFFIVYVNGFVIVEEGQLIQVVTEDFHPYELIYNTSYIELKEDPIGDVTDINFRNYDISLLFEYDGQSVQLLNEAVGSLKIQHFIKDEEVSHVLYQDGNSMIWNSSDGNGTTFQVPTEQFGNRFHDVIPAIDDEYLWMAEGYCWEDEFDNVYRMPLDQPFLTGTLYYDSNNDGEQQVGEPGISELKLNIPEYNVVVLPNAEGYFSVPISADDIITLEFQNPSEVASQSVDLPLTISNYDTAYNIGVDVLNSADYINWSYNIQRSRCNETRTGRIVLDGNKFESYDNVFVELVASPELTLTSIEGASQLPNELSFESVGLNWPDNQIYNFEIEWPDETFTGESFEIEMLVGHVSGGDTLLESKLYETILNCSYDPNEKEVSPAGRQVEHYTLFEDELLYTIHFQNTGNDTAYVIALIDTLSPSLDWNTLKFKQATHSYTSYLDSNVLHIAFDDIFLPDSTTDLEGSMGYVSFEIATSPELEDFTVINNEASILFDYNPAILTNQVFNTMVTNYPTVASVDLDGINFDKYGHLSPNPTVGLLHVAETISVKSIEVYNSLGVFMGDFSDNTIDMSDYEQGAYLVVIETDTEVYREKVIKQ